ncbi:MAG: phytanoyl-CoA dioxygenase [Porticoccaceae bacterium]|nr:phytanoyl-CoA dioxygenase [Porticoccaceae bacterium]
MNSMTDLYPSRNGSAETILPRHDPVVYPDPFPDSPYGLTDSQLESYEEDGFIILPNYVPELVEPLLAEKDRLARELDGQEELYTEPDSDELRTLFKPFAFSELIDRVSRDPRILHPVQQLLGSRAYLMQSRINVKPAFKGKAFPWHSDFETWHVEDGMPRMRALTAWIMLTENHPDNGPLMVMPGSHKHYISCTGRTGAENYRTSLKKQVLGVPSKETMKEVAQTHPVAGIYGKPGTLVIHECNLLHGSEDNSSPDPRTVLMFVYNSIENRPVSPYGGQKPRPHYLASRDTSPLKPLECPISVKEEAAIAGAIA